MEFLNISTRNFAQQITRHRRFDYSDQPFQIYFSKNPHLTQQRILLRNAFQEQLDCLIIKSAKNDTSTVIIYAHGLGSNKLQIISLLKRAQQMKYDILAFDFSGNGKSEGHYCSFGIKQKYDIQCVLNYSDQVRKYSNIFLWGRSMGAVSIILHQASNRFNEKIKGIIVDSPFCSFEKVVIQMAAKKTIFPEFVLNPLVNSLKEYFKTNQPYNPFQIELEKEISKVRANIFIIFSKNDSIVSHQHSIKLIKACRKIPYTFQINEDHNASRRRQTYCRILSFVQDCLGQNKRKNRLCSKSKGINLTSRSRKIEVFSSLSKINMTSIQKRDESISEKHFQKYQSLSHRNSSVGIQNTVRKSIIETNRSRVNSFQAFQISLQSKYAKNSPTLYQKLLKKSQNIKKIPKCKLHQQNNPKNVTENSNQTKIGTPKDQKQVIYEQIKTQGQGNKFVRSFKKKCRNSALRPTINLMRKHMIYPL